MNAERFYSASVLADPDIPLTVFTKNIDKILAKTIKTQKPSPSFSESILSPASSLTGQTSRTSKTSVAWQIPLLQKQAGMSMPISKFKQGRSQSSPKNERLVQSALSLRELEQQKSISMLEQQLASMSTGTSRNSGDKSQLSGNLPNSLATAHARHDGVCLPLNLSKRDAGQYAVDNYMHWVGSALCRTVTEFSCVHFKLLCIRECLTSCRAGIKICNRAVQITDNLHIVSECWVDKLYPLCVDFGWIDTVNHTPIGRCKGETNCFVDKLLIFRQVSISNRWSGNRRHIVCINLRGRITTDAGNWNGLRCHCLGFASTECTGDSRRNFVWPTKFTKVENFFNIFSPSTGLGIVLSTAWRGTTAEDAGAFGDANHAGNVVTRRLHTGI